MKKCLSIWILITLTIFSYGNVREILSYDYVAYVKSVDENGEPTELVSIKAPEGKVIKIPRVIKILSSSSEEDPFQTYFIACNEDGSHQMLHITKDSRVYNGKKHVSTDNYLKLLRDTYEEIVKNNKEDAN